MVAKRKALSKRIRFEVFKRDGFKCQYCGVCAPDVLLHIDHIKPVSEGGTNELLNLVTSCAECNLGKGARELDDQSVIEKQRRQLDHLNERREQMKMLVEWHAALSSLEDEKVDHICVLFAEKTGYEVNQHGRGDIEKALKQHPFQRVLQAVGDATKQYLMPASNGEGYTRESAEKALSYIRRICGVMKDLEKKPYLKDLYYIRGIYRNRIGFHSSANQWQVLHLLEDAYLAGVPVEVLQEAARSCHNWSSFRSTVVSLAVEGGHHA